MIKNTLCELYITLTNVRNKYGDEICKKLSIYCEEHSKNIISVVNTPSEWKKFMKCSGKIINNLEKY